MNLLASVNNLSNFSKHAYYLGAHLISSSGNYHNETHSISSCRGVWSDFQRDTSTGFSKQFRVLICSCPLFRMCQSTGRTKLPLARRTSLLSRALSSGVLHQMCLLFSARGGRSRNGSREHLPHVLPPMIFVQVSLHFNWRL